MRLLQIDGTYGLRITQNNETSGQNIITYVAQEPNMNHT